MLNFCTLFDSNYLLRGLALYNSLKNQCTNFHLYIFAFNDLCFETLSKLNLDNATIIKLKDFEDDELLKIKPSRSKGEYCWTCTPSIILYSITKFQLDHCTYLDSDIFFFSDPKILIDEMGKKSVSMTLHNFHPNHDQSEASGKYCVQFMTFRNNKKGLEVLKYWRYKCIEWCFNRHEDGKFGDQKYLDDWMTRFDCCYEISNIGAGIAPWNLENFQIFREKDQIICKKHDNSLSFPVVFYHFHNLRFENSNLAKQIGYKINPHICSLFYIKYLKEINNIFKKVKNLAKNQFFDFNKKTSLYKYFSTKVIKNNYQFNKKGLIKF